MKVGCHLSIVPRFSTAVEEAASLGCETLQIFPGNPRSWKRRPLDPHEARAFKSAARRKGVRPVYVHASYLVNLASESAEVRRKSRAAFFDELERTRVLGARGYVIHVHGAETPKGVKRFVRALRDGLARVKSVKVVLENTARTRSFEALAAVMRGARSTRARLCLDTAHSYAAGFDLSRKRGLRVLLEHIEDTVGLDRLEMVHANDTRAELGSGVDRHWHIGRGRIGTRGFRMLCAARELKDLPFILETPRERKGDDKRNLGALRRAVRYGTRR